MKKFFEFWKKYRVAAIVVAGLIGTPATLIVPQVLDGADAIHDKARADLGKSPVEVPAEPKQGGE